MKWYLLQRCGKCMVALHDCLDVVRTFSLDDVEVTKNLFCVIPSAQVFQTFRRPCASWDICCAWSSYGGQVKKIATTRTRVMSCNVQMRGCSALLSMSEDGRRKVCGDEAAQRTYRLRPENGNVHRVFCGYTTTLAMWPKSGQPENPCPGHSHDIPR